MTTASNAAVVAALGIEIGDVIADRYRIGSVLGAGGMGVVFGARHTKLGGEFALKFLVREATSIPEAVERFQREARAAAALRNEHVVQVFDVGTHSNGSPYIVMEHLAGDDLGSLLKQSGPLALPDALDFGLQACAAIASAHRAGIIHRDLKPSNLFRVPREGRPPLIKVLDFGISKLMLGSSSDAGMTITGNLLGSPSYMSPEQMKTPNRVDFRTDIWSLGVVLYEFLTAKLPFAASSILELCLRVVEEPPIPPSAFRTELPPTLEGIVLKCLAKDPAARYANVGELMSALRDVTPGPGLAREPASVFGLRGVDSPRVAARGSTTVTDPSWAQSAPQARSSRRPLILGALALLAAALVVAAFRATGASSVPGSGAETPRLAESSVAAGGSPSPARVDGRAPAMVRPAEGGLELPRQPATPQPSDPSGSTATRTIQASRPGPGAVTTEAARPAPSERPSRGRAKPALERNTQTTTWRR